MYVHVYICPEMAFILCILRIGMWRRYRDSRILSGFNPGIGNCNPGTQNLDFRQIFVEIAHLSIIYKIAHS
jgi:hypothetical protein